MNVAQKLFDHHQQPAYATVYHNWCKELQALIISEIENIEQEYITQEYTSQKLSYNETKQNLEFLAPKFEKKGWSYSQFGGGESALLTDGKVFEKAGVNVSCVWGAFAPEFAQNIPGASENPDFWACGISLVMHPRNPHVPIVHLNTRHIVTTKSWFGGGLDLTPTFPNEQDTADFHNCLKQTCDQFDPHYYQKFSKWCADYFYLPHRNEQRGVGGIFYDYINNDNFDQDFAFNKAVGLAFLKIYPTIVRRSMHTTFSQADEKALLKKRSRYVEFNLLYDRGTQFGLKTGGNVEAILMSMPPRASW